MTTVTVNTGETPLLMPPLRRYQAEVLRAVLDSVLHDRGLSFSVEISRQGGKNELSARLELCLLALFADRHRTAVKAAPTLRPQAMISFNRLWDRVRDAGFTLWAAKEQGHVIRLGRARQVFLSAEPNSNVVGHTADLLLEVDEAQDVDPEKFDKELRPMVASTGATTVLYGTAWDDASLLERAKGAHLEAERRDGIRRHFEYAWEAVAATSPAYARFIEDERARLGAEHPIFLSQYCLRTLPGAGRLLGPAQLSLLRGSHPRLGGRLAGETYVAGLDLAGEGPAETHDSTVLTVARVGSQPSGSVAPEAGEERPLPPTAAAPTQLEVVCHYAWTAAPLVDVQGALVSLLKHTWRAVRVAVDATGLGEPVAAFLRQQLGDSRVMAVKLSAEAKSRLGFDLLAAVNCGGLRLYSGPAPELSECWRQLERCRATFRANRTLAFAVDPADGHDDYVISLALAVAAARGAAPRRARGRLSADFEGGPQWLP